MCEKYSNALLGPYRLAVSGRDPLCGPSSWMLGVCRAEPCAFLISSVVPFRFCVVVLGGENCSVVVAGSEFGNQFPAH